MDEPPVVLSVIVPVYNEESTIGDVVERVSAAIPHVSKEIIVVDDGSSDGTGSILESKRDIVKHLHYSRINVGKGAAIRIGLTYASGTFVIIQDADLELDPNEYRWMLEPLLGGACDVVYGSRFLDENALISTKTRIANRVLTTLTNVLFGSRLTDMETAYKAFRREVVTSLDLRCRRFEFEPEVTAKLLRAGYEIEEVPISYTPRTVSEGKKIRWHDGAMAIATLIRCRLERRRPRERSPSAKARVTSST
jgi:glycosyltransferase involved in cell wall biosynthesis